MKNVEKYRLLTDGELIMAGDECSMGQGWMTVRATNDKVYTPYSSTLYRPMRRKITNE
ncbi:hypothetical protein [uncultured Desulfuromonas sp.]|uniref:hypothetical protein n=1 Tax=uncultured Desulfuromonas sp. TaxID=181013 RepID=UPI002AAAD98C|nr:hypothetical protein [uncultured Desulfuromonas sp.]